MLAKVVGLGWPIDLYVRRRLHGVPRVSLFVDHYPYLLVKLTRLRKNFVEAAAFKKVADDDDEKGGPHIQMPKLCGFTSNVQEWRNS